VVNPASPLHRRIIAARRAVAIAESVYEFTLLEVQEKCRHADIVEKDGFDTPLTYQMPARLCRRCKLVEEAWAWGPNSETTWSSDNGREPRRVRLTGPTTMVSRERFRECWDE
jgi:hypothetical protein